MMIWMYQWLCSAFLCLSVLCQTLRADSRREMTVPELAIYLGSPSGDPTVCSQRSEGGYQVVVTVKSAGEWLTSFTTDAVPKERWKLCTIELLSSLPEAQVVLLLDAMAISHQILLRNSGFESNESLQRKMELLHNLVFERKLSNQQIRALEADFTKNLDIEINNHRLGRSATRIAYHFIEKCKYRNMNYELLDLSKHKVINASLKTDFIQTHGVLVRQMITDRLFAASPHLFKYEEEKRQVVPSVDLKDGLLIELEGVASPVALCPSVPNMNSQAAAPCISTKDITIEHPLTMLDTEGKISLAAKLTTTQFMQLAKSNNGLVLPIRIGGQQMLTLSWKLYFERPPNLVMRGQSEGDDGPALWVLIDHRDPSRFLISVVGVGETRRFVLDLSDAAGFRIVSEGAQGADGRGGEGNRAQWFPRCDLGGDGRPGKAGGNGGRIYVSMLCGEANCTHTKMVAQNMMLSLGGPGGLGGPGYVPIDPDYKCRSGEVGAHGAPGLVKFDVIVAASQRPYEE